MFLRENDMMTQTLSLFLVRSRNKHKIESGRGVSFFFFSLATLSPWLSLSPSKTEKKQKRELTEFAWFVVFLACSLSPTLSPSKLFRPLSIRKNHARALFLSRRAQDTCVRIRGWGGKERKNISSFFVLSFRSRCLLPRPLLLFPRPLSLSQNFLNLLTASPTAPSPCNRSRGPCTFSR